MNVALWVGQVLLAFAFIAAGGMKVFAYEKYKAMSEKNGPTGITRGLTAFIGIVELAGAFGIVLPVATGVAPWLSAWAAVGLATVMLVGGWLSRAPPRVSGRARHSLGASRVCCAGALFSLGVKKQDPPLHFVAGVIYLFPRTARRG